MTGGFKVGFVTLFRAVPAYTPYGRPGEDEAPVVQVTFDEAQAYRLPLREGHQARGMLAATAAKEDADQIRALGRLNKENPPPRRGSGRPSMRRGAGCT